MDIGVKRIIALILVIGYIGLSAYGMISGRVLTEGYVGITSMVVGYYFGKGGSTKDKTGGV